MRSGSQADRRVTKAWLHGPRLNQQQLARAAEKLQRVGLNRPDIQATSPEGLRVHIEIESFTSLRGPAHAWRILANDPDAIVFVIKFLRQ